MPGHTSERLTKTTPVADGEVTASAITYGETLSKSTISGKMKDPVTDAEVEGTFMWKNADDKPMADYRSRNTMADWVFTPTGENAYRYEAVTGQTRVVANKAQFTNFSVRQVGTLTYNGQPQTAAVKTAATSVDGISGTFGFSAKNGIDTAYQKDVPAFTDAGEHTVCYVVYDVVNWNYEYFKGEFTVTIEPKEVTATVTVPGGPFIYNGGKWKPPVTVKDGGTVIDPAEYTVSYDRNTNAGEATVTVTDNPGGNYTVSGTASFTIDKANAQLTGHPTANTLTYTGAEQALAAAGTAEGGTMQYSLDGVDYSADIPTGRLPGTYTVYYKVQGDENHNSTDVWSLTAAIDKAELTNVSASAPALAYNGKTQTPAVTVTADTADGSPVTVTYSEEENGAYTASVPSYSAVGSYTLYYRLTAANHEPASGSLSVSVDRGTLTVPDITVTVRLCAVNKLIPTGTPSLSSRFLTGGQRLDTITLSGIMAAGGKVVRGTFTWAEPYLCPAVGRYTATWVFTPDDTDRYAAVTGTADITVTAPAEPVYTVSGEVKGIDLTDSTRPGAPVPDAVVTIRSASGLTQTDTLLEIILSYDTSLSGITVLRSGKFEPRGLTGSEAEGYYVDKANGRIRIFTRQMTTYAIGYAVSGSKPDSTPSIRDTTSPATGDAGLAVYAVMVLSSCTGAAPLLRRRREHA